MGAPLDLNSYKYFALLNGNGQPEGFKNILLTGKKNKFRSASSFVFYSYDHKNKLEDLRSEKPDNLYFEDFTSFEVEKIIPLSDLQNMLEIKTDRISPITLIAKTNREDYIKNVRELKKHIQNGDIYEINYCITFEAKNVTIDPYHIYSVLDHISKAPYSALVKLDDKFIISASPELFLAKRKNILYTKPIKGTAKRGQSPGEDEKLRSELFNSIKERTENVMIVDVARNDLSRLAKKGTVTVDKLYNIESYEQVHQMVSTISCELKENTSFNDIIRATFPMASMTGAPKIRAMELIDDFESYNRGPYSGCMGYIDEEGDFDLSVLIRSIFYNEKEKYLSFSVGSAITAMCDPEKEYEECLLKASAMKKVLENNY